MSERPIIFSADSVRAILDGRKTQTRRVVTVPWTRRTRTTPYSPYYEDADGVLMEMDEAGHYHPLVEVMTSPFGRPGDRLWVREAWHAYGRWSLLQCAEGDDPSDYVWRDASTPEHLRYAADDPTDLVGVNDGLPFPYLYHRKRPSIHMPRWASRITLEVVGVRVERLQAITEADARAEGVEPNVYNMGAALVYLHSFRRTWDALNAKRGYPWDANPWVWCVTFRKVEDDS